MSSRSRDVYSHWAGLPAFRTAGRAKVLAVAALLGLGAAAPALAQITFDEVEAALSALEETAGTQGAASQDNPVTETTLPPVTEITPPPDGLVTPPGDDPQAGLERNTSPFLPILADQDCPQRLPEITAQAEELVAQSAALEAKALGLDQRFAILDEANRSQEIDQDLVECPAEFLADVAALQEDLGVGDLAQIIQEAESFSVCVQSGLQTQNDRMETLAQSDDPNANTDRLAVGGLLRRLSAIDVQVTSAVGKLVFVNQRRQRLENATGKFLRRCEILGGY